MSELKLKGHIKKILPIQSGVSKAGKDWSKQDFLIETQDQYPKMVCFTLFGDKMDILQYYKIDQFVEVHFNIESREYNEKYFHNINAWKIKQIATEAQTTDEQVDDVEVINSKEDEGLPF